MILVSGMEETMAGTYTQIYIQVIFAVQGRQDLLSKDWRDEVFNYMAGIIKNKGQKPIIVNEVDDHVHALWEFKPAMALSDLVRDIKNNITPNIYFRTNIWASSNSRSNIIDFIGNNRRDYKMPLKIGFFMPKSLIPITSNV